MSTKSGVGMGQDENSRAEAAANLETSPIGHRDANLESNFAANLKDLEIKYSHHEVAIEELQKVVFEQHKTIEKLEKTLKRLTDRFDGVTSGANEIGPGNEKPPHY